MRLLTFTLFVLGFSSCQNATNEVNSNTPDKVSPTVTSTTTLVILGTVQDAGSPHIACKKECCKRLFSQPDTTRKVVSLGVIDSENQKKYLFEATPDMTTQLKKLKSFSGFNDQEIPDGVFLTHAHIGHYTGLMYFGKEAMNANKIPVFAMPKMKSFLEDNGPWSQLINTNNISIQEMNDSTEIKLTSNLTVIPFLVPHRDEYSETVGYKIIGPNKSALFIPDIDKWEKWGKDIIEEIAQVDYAFLDATFFSGNEINTRDISQIPHPFIIESMQRFKGLPKEEKDKVYFIHFNHTNPALNAASKEFKAIKSAGFSVSEIYSCFAL